VQIGVIYCNQGQRDPLKMFKNKPSEEFDRFLDDMGVDKEKLKTGISSSSWKFLKVTWHLSPYETKEQHRRLIGNDLVLIFFLEAGSKRFDVINCDKLGVFPQIFIVVQAYKDNKYRVGTFYRKSLDVFDPPVPTNYIFDENEIQDYLMVKIYNGLMTTLYCPPMSKLFIEPRNTAIKELAQKCKEKKAKHQFPYQRYLG